MINKRKSVNGIKLICIQITYVGLVKIMHIKEFSHHRWAEVKQS
jgi:hypothetical protein